MYFTFLTSNAFSSNLNTINLKILAIQCGGIYSIDRILNIISGDRKALRSQ